MRVLIGNDGVLRAYPFNRREALMLEELLETLKTTAFGHEGRELDPESPDGFRNFEIVNGSLREIDTNTADHESAPVIDK